MSADGINALLARLERKTLELSPEDLIMDRRAARDTIRSLATEMLALREALKPFADCASHWDAEKDGATHVFFEAYDDGDPVPSLPVNDFRQARFVLKQIE